MVNVEEDRSVLSSTEDPEQIMLDIEKGNILRDLQEQSKTTTTAAAPTTTTLETPSHVRFQHGMKVYHYKWAFSFVILMLGAVASTLVLWLGISGAQQNNEQSFNNEAKQLSNAIEISWEGYQTLASWIHESCHFNVSGATSSIDDVDNDKRPLFSIVGFCSRDKFQHIYEYIRTEKPFVAMQYIPNITHDLRQKLEEESRLYLSTNNIEFNYSGIQDYKAFPNATFIGLFPSPPRPFYFPIHYLEPLEGNEKALDLDMYSLRKDEIDKAMQTVKPVLGPRAKLFRENLPDVYAVELIHPGRPTSIKNDLSIGDGISKLTIRVPDLIEQAAKATGSRLTSVYIYDETPNPNGEPVFLAAADIVCGTKHNQTAVLKPEIPIENITKSKHSYTTTIQAADHTWRIVVQGNQPDNIAWQILAGIAIFIGCCILVIAFHINLNRVAKVQKLHSIAEAEKAELALIQARRETHLNDFIAHEVVRTVQL